MKVLIVVTHLLGTGHLSRALTLGRAFAAEGHAVTVASGGFPAPQLDSSGVTLVNLPPLRSDGVDFARLLGPEATPADQTYLDQRTSALLACLDRVQPDILITELFPFGRRSLRHEFGALLAAARALPRPPCILASVRDILAPPSKPEKATKTDALLADFYDGVLVHSDPTVTGLEASWPVSDQLRPRLHYTGYVAPPAAQPHPGGAGQAEILVSAGGGSVGDHLFDAAIAAARLMPDRRWRLLVGGTDTDSRIARLQAQGTPAVIEAARPDFRQMLRQAAVSVSMCGYNTAMDLLQGGTAAVLIPFDDGKEVEQTLRASSLAHLSGMRLLTSGALTPETLCAAVAEVMQDPPRATDQFHFDGASRTVKIAVLLAEARQ